MKIAKTTLLIFLLVSSAALAADATVQPLTRSDCDKAGMQWDDGANVCGSTQDASKDIIAPKAESSSSSVATPQPSGKVKKSGVPSTRKSAIKKQGSQKKSEPNQIQTSKKRPFRLLPNAGRKETAPR